MDNEANKGMKPKDALKKVIAEFCKEIGCTMMSPARCPGDHLCGIVRKAMPWVKDIEARNE